MKPMSHRHFIRWLKDEGFVLQRARGKHEIWKHPDGRSVAFPHSPNGDVVTGDFLRRVRKV